MKEIGSVMPSSLAMIYNKALELASFAAALPLIEKIKDGDLGGAIGQILSMPLLKLVAKMDVSMPRDILKKILQNDALQASIDSALSSMQGHLREPLEMLQKFAQNLDGNMDEIMLDLNDILKSMKVYAAAPNIDFSFPMDLVKGIDPIDILKTIGDKLPAPLGMAYGKALELAAFAPLLPMVELVRRNDLQGALAAVLSVPVLKCLKSLNADLPRDILKKNFQNNFVQTAIEQTIERLPDKLHPPLVMLVTFSQNLGGNIDEILSNLGDVLQNFTDYAAVYQAPKVKPFPLPLFLPFLSPLSLSPSLPPSFSFYLHTHTHTNTHANIHTYTQPDMNKLHTYTITHTQINFNFPQDLIAKVDPASILQMIGDNLPEPMKSNVSSALKGIAPAVVVSSNPTGITPDDESEAPTGVTSGAEVEDLEVTSGAEVEDLEVAKKEKEPQSFVAMIDKLLSKVDPAAFIKLIEKLHSALPPPGQEVLEPFMAMLKEACAMKAQVCKLVVINFV